MQREISGFKQDEEGHWVAALLCGHTQHIRHAPPFQSRPWVETEAGRAEKIGQSLDCLYCNMASLPADLQPYKQTATFDEQTVPKGLLRDHTTRAGVWAKIVVEQGKLEYTCRQGVFVLKPGTLGIVEPQAPHHVRPLGPVRFHVVFCAKAQADATGNANPHDSKEPLV